MADLFNYVATFSLCAGIVVLALGLISTLLYIAFDITKSYLNHLNKYFKGN